MGDLQLQSYRLSGSLQGTLGTRGPANVPLPPSHCPDTRGHGDTTPVVNTASLNQNHLADKILGMPVKDARSSRPRAWLCGAV